MKKLLFTVQYHGFSGITSRLQVHIKCSTPPRRPHHQLRPTLGRMVVNSTRRLIPRVRIAASP